MTKSLHKKLTDTNTLQGYKHEKLNPSRRAVLNVDAQKAIELGVANPVNDAAFQHMYDRWMKESK